MEEAKEQINLRVLSKYDDSIKALLKTISHVVLYDFNMKEQKWNKRGIEGTLFVYERSTLPKYGFFILNRLSLTNLAVTITQEFQVQRSGDYLMYKTDEDLVHGLWIFGEDDRKNLLHQLDQYVCSNISCVLKSQIIAEVSVSPDPISTVSLEEIWAALETMAPHPNVHLSENEFLARFRILVQSPFFARALYMGYVNDRKRAVVSPK